MNSIVFFPKLILPSFPLNDGWYFFLTWLNNSKSRVTLDNICMKNDFHSVNCHTWLHVKVICHDNIYLCFLRLIWNKNLIILTMVRIELWYIGNSLIIVKTMQYYHNFAWEMILGEMKRLVGVCLLVLHFFCVC